MATPSNRYVREGRKVWGVTDVIREAGAGVDFSMVPRAVLQAGIDRGNAVHTAIQFLAEDDLDRATVDPAIAGYVAAYEQFVVDTGYRPIVAEVPMYSSVYDLCGQPDQLGWFRTMRILFDIKTASAPSPGPLGLQLAAYEHLCGVLWPREPLQRVYLFQPRADGTYRFRQVSTDRAWRVFQYCLRVVRDQAADWERDEIGRWVADGRKAA